MKKLLVVLILLLVPSIAFAKEVNIRATISPSIKDVNITEIVVSLEDNFEVEGTKDYSIYKSKSYVGKFTDYRDSENGKFVYATVLIDNKVDAVGRYEVTCTSTREYSGAYFMDLLVTDTKATSTTTTEVTTTQQSVEKKQKKHDNLVAYGIIAIIILVLLILILSFLAKALKASSMY